MIHLSRINHCSIDKNISRAKTIRRCVSPKSLAKRSKDKQERVRNSELVERSLSNTDFGNSGADGCTPFC